jgi:hypothetical protein
MNNVVSFLLLYLLGSIGAAIIQDSFNDVLPAEQQNWNANPQATGPAAPIVAAYQPDTAPTQPATVASQSQSPQIPPKPPVSPSHQPPLVSG